MKKLLELAILADQLRDGIAELIAQSGIDYPGPISPPAKPITSVVIENLGDTQSNIPVTFGHVFAKGDLQAGMGLRDAQLDVKATHPDGSVRHAVISTVLPKLDKGEKLEFPLVPEKVAKVVTKEVIPTTSLALEITVTLAGKKYTAERAVGEVWLNGPVVQELYGNVPLQDEANHPHPHLSTRLALRMYENGARRFDITIENAWAYEPEPQNFTYDVSIAVAGKVVFSQNNLTHYHHARWRKVFWAGESPNVHVRHNTAYLINTLAVPNYDQSIVFTEQAIADGVKSWAKAGKAPMETGLTMRAMPTTGGRGDIGIMPSWASAYLLTMDERLKEATIETANLAGSFPMHYRDKDTGKPISLIDYPYMTLVGNPGDTYNPVTKKRESFPTATSKNVVESPNKPDIPHHPGLPYSPYLVTGDLYHLEELQFWAMYCVFSANPGAKYRDGIKGLLKAEQTRGEAWGLRTLAQAAYITPDADRLKSHFNQILDNNLDWYNSQYTDNPNANKLGALVHGYAIVYKWGDKNLKLSLGPWQDDFFTQVIGHIAELGYEKAVKLLKWKTKFVTERVLTCLTHAAIYSLKVRDTESGPIFETVDQAFRSMDTPNGPLFLSLGYDTAAQAKALGLKAGEMTGYADGNQGYPSNMQPALAFAADYFGEDGKRAWKKFTARSVKPDYSKGPQFAILPRSM